MPERSCFRLPAQVEREGESLKEGLGHLAGMGHTGSGGPVCPHHLGCPMFSPPGSVPPGSSWTGFMPSRTH